MIAKLKGIIDNIGEDCCIIDVNGVGYLVNMSSRSLSKLKQGEFSSLLIETVIKEDSITLFGFQSPWEKEWFNTLTKIQGVGGKVCLSILSALTPSQLAQAVSAQDKGSFLRANGVGPKLAARLVTELKDKIVTVPIGDVCVADLSLSEQISENTTIAGDTGAMEDVISALVNLGYQQRRSYGDIESVIQEAKARMSVPKK